MTTRRYGITVPAEPRWLKLVRAFARPLLDEVAPQDAERILLAVDESCANVVKHRCDSLSDLDLSVSIEVDDRLIQFRFDKFCLESNLPDIKPRALDEVRPGGLGTHFVSEVMDRVRYEEDPERPEVRALVLEKDLQSAGEDDGRA